MTPPTLERTNNPEIETVRCWSSPLYFILHYCQIYDNETKQWIEFELWRQQIDALFLFHENQKVIALKARQLGMSWLALAYALWQMIFQPIATVLIFSKDETSAIYLLGDERLRGMYRRLPDFLKPGESLDNAKTWMLANGSTARAFAKTGGDSYSATLAIIDEADVVPNLNAMMRAIAPTVDTGGKLFLISRADKSKPGSEFKKIYLAAKAGLNDYVHIFLPWWVRPERTREWYEKQKRDIETKTGSLDDLYEQYPATEEEALRPAEKHKRIPLKWLMQCYVEQTPIDFEDIPYNTKNPVPLIDGLRIFKLPEQNHIYASAADCAEGLPHSDDSVSQFVDVRTGEQVAVLSGKFTPEDHAAYTARIAMFYNHAKICPENNTYGYAFILWLKENRYGNLLIKGHDGKDGWSSNTVGKVLMYDAVTQGAKDQTYTIHDSKTKDQLLAIEVSTLRAPEGEGDLSMDDHADAWAIVEAIRASVVSTSDLGMRQVKVKGR
jgi:hypothetical protein